ncbi:MAG TPA: pyridoxamine 5'-phosphate oxidase family protein, partial [Candidatus Competibacteraceae bacterium]|nr:pyridoxamine 5'-phosphate oxidase family protein [Candidatus Competibacteraceae bacterium]
MDADAEGRLLALLGAHRWAALATLGRNGPEASWVAYALEPGGGVLLHLSRLAAHTRNLLREPRASLAVSEPERPGHDPQQLARVTLFGQVAPIPREAAQYPVLRQCYLARLPEAEPLFGFGDFHLFLLLPERARFVGGFAQAHT